SEPAKAAELVGKVGEDSPFFAQADAIQVFAELDRLKRNEDELSPSSKAEFLTAVDALQKEQFEVAMENFLTILTGDNTYQNGIASRAIVSIFTLLGTSHPLTKEYSKR